MLNRRTRFWWPECRYFVCLRSRIFHFSLTIVAYPLTRRGHFRMDIILRTYITLNKSSTCIPIHASTHPHTRPPLQSPRTCPDRQTPSVRPSVRPYVYVYIYVYVYVYVFVQAPRIVVKQYERAQVGQSRRRVAVAVAVSVSV